MLWNYLNDPENEKLSVVTLFVAVCRASSASSLFFLRAQCPLKLTSSSSLSNRKRKNNLQRWNKKINRESWPQYTWTIIDHSDRCPFARACSSNTYINIRFGTSSATATAILNSKNRRVKSETSGMLHLYQFHCRFFKLDFLKQVGHAKGGHATRDCANLPGPTYL